MFFRTGISIFSIPKEKRNRPAPANERYSVNVSEEKRETARAEVGLCADCRFMRLIESDRGSAFYLCGLSATDARFPKYPRLPVLRCAGYKQLPADRESNSSAN
ncbi:MAG: hypothetical protein DMG79_10635 [Acidobacteria bacterium]|nr:MAG: hypothetical protein DMG79_10635 [Acidobacteriota bacterium]